MKFSKVNCYHVFSKLTFQADSGGPVFEAKRLPGNNVVYTLTGIICSGDKTCSAKKIRPQTATAVAFFSDWIKDKMRL
jgi:secreted trypsin-like serine protease